MAKSKPEAVLAILSDMETDLHRVDDYMLVVFMALGGGGPSTLDENEVEAVKRLVVDAHDTFLGTKKQWERAFNAAHQEKNAKAA